MFSTEMMTPMMATMNSHRHMPTAPTRSLQRPKRSTPHMPERVTDTWTMLVLITIANTGAIEEGRAVAANGTDAGELLP
ncbi:hypothetical protein HGRIS_008859 [Hohenbuehelia grisea]|uniref:Uncharacterized protein n=1 Tax=Hohenbuehelia grisea TaxID=104357 RepID=A0ABR3IZC7_9AGAR